MSGHIAFIARPTAAMRDMRWYFDRNWAKRYKQRRMVERVFSRLKNCFGLACQLMPKRDGP